MSHREPNPDDQYAARTLNRSVFHEKGGAGGEPVRIAAPSQAAPSSVPASQCRVAPPSESDFGLKVALAVVAVLVLVHRVFLVSLTLPPVTTAVWTPYAAGRGPLRVGRQGTLSGVHSNRLW